MEKQILEMLVEMKTEMTEMKAEMNKGFSEVNRRIDGLEVKVDTLEEKVDKGFAEMTMWHGERSIESVKLLTSIDRRFDKMENVVKDVKYLKHKVAQLEQEVFLLNPEQ